MFRSLQVGGDLASAVMAEIGSLVQHDRVGAANALASSLREAPSTRALGEVASGVLAYRRGFYPLAHRLLRDVPRELWVRHAPREFVRSGLLNAPEPTLEEIRGLVRDDPDDVPVKSWFEVMSVVLGFEEHALARELFAIYDRRSQERPDEWMKADYRREWLRPWMASDGASPSAPPAADGHVSFALIDYGNPDRHTASLNVGDHVQTLASLGHLVRHQGVRFHGDPETAAMLEDLQQQVPDDLRRTGAAADVDVVTFDRDASTYNELPPQTWTIAFGWYMHAIYQMKHQFPLHANLRPIFVSFHCNQRGMLTPEALDYLRAHGPIGCRDWTTVDLLLAADVPAFFTGCITTTVSTVFSGRSPEAAPAGGVAYIDIEGNASETGQAFKQTDDAMRTRTIAQNIYFARDLLEEYRSFRRIVTSRLHCYLPSRSLGLDVDFHPKRRSDIRFTGLIDIDGDGFEAIRGGILDLLEEIMVPILAGESSAAVYERWRALTADRVALARERHERQADLTAPSDLGDRIGAARATRTSAGSQEAGSPTMNLATVVTSRQLPQLRVLAQSVAHRASRPISWTVLTSADLSRGMADLAAETPGIEWSTVDTGDLGEPATLFLPDLLPELTRVVVLPVESVVTVDIADLWDLDLGDNTYAAPNAAGSAPGSGINVVFGAALRRGNDAAGAGELRRDGLARQPYDLVASRTDVMVMALDAMRKNDFVAEAGAYVSHYGLSVREVLTLLEGSRRAVLPVAWSYIPTRSDDRPAEVALVHYADNPKPWDASVTPEQDTWLSERARLD